MIILYQLSQWMLIGYNSQRLQASNILDNVYVKSVIQEEELSWARMQMLVGNNYAEIQPAFNNFLNNLAITNSVC